jgi:hypothetical protein
MRPMITNGGPHPADKFADMSTDDIMDLLVDANPDADTPAAAAARQAKRDLRPILFNIFNGHHERVQKHEHGHLTTNVKKHEAREHAHSRIDVTPHMGVMDEVFAALAETPFAEHFAQPHVREVLKQIIGRDTANAMHLERRYHADRHEAKGA